MYTDSRMIAIMLLGFVSGLPLALTASTLGTWQAEVGVSLESIGFFALIGTPYTLKFLWSPLIDGFKIPFFSRVFGKRRGWLFFTQILLMGSLSAMAFSDPIHTPWHLALYAFLTAIFSATQDTVIDAYRVDLLDDDEQGAGSAMSVFGYRLGMIASTTGALYISNYYGWQITYLSMAGLILIGTLAALFAGEPDYIEFVDDSKKSIFRIFYWFEEYFIKPFTDFMKKDYWYLVLLFILLYKMGDAFIGVMTNPFLLQIGFTKIQIADIVKLYGLIATITGGFIGGWLVGRIGIMRSLFICGIGHALTNLMFVYQAKIGADFDFLKLSISLENISGGMSLSALVAYLGSLVNKKFTATQYALLSSFSAFGRTWLSAPSGMVAQRLGWEHFFIFSVALALPSLIILLILQRKMKDD